MRAKTIFAILFAFVFVLNLSFGAVGDIIWKTQYNPSSYYDFSYGTCTDGKYVYAVGYTYDEGDGDSSGSSVLILKLNKITGAVLQTMKYEPNDNSADDDYDYLYDCVIVGNYLYAVGYTYSFGDSGRHIVKIDLSTFSKVAEYNYNYHAGQGDLWRAIDTDSQYLYVSGEYFDGSVFYFIVQKLDLNGNVLATWKADAETTFRCRSGSVSHSGWEYTPSIVYKNGYVYIGGRYICNGDWDGDGNAYDYDYRTVLIKLNATDLTLNKYYVKDWLIQNFEGFQDEEIIGIYSYGNNTFATGYYKDGANKYHGFVMKLDDDLNELAEKTWTTDTYGVYPTKIYATKDLVYVFSYERVETWHQTLNIFDNSLSLLNKTTLDSDTYPSYFSIGKVGVDEINGELFVSGYKYVNDYEWVIYSIEMPIPQKLYVVFKLNKTTDYYYNFETIPINITNPFQNDVNVTIQFYIDDNSVENKTITVPANSSIIENLSTNTYYLTHGEHVLRVDYTYFNPEQNETVNVTIEQTIYVIRYNTKVENVSINELSKITTSPMVFAYKNLSNVSFEYNNSYFNIYLLKVEEENMTNISFIISSFVGLNNSTIFNIPINLSLYYEDGDVENVSIVLNVSVNKTNNTLENTYIYETETQPVIFNFTNNITTDMIKNINLKIIANNITYNYSTDDCNIKNNQIVCNVNLPIIDINYSETDFTEHKYLTNITLTITSIFNDDYEINNQLYLYPIRLTETGASGFGTFNIKTYDEDKRQLINHTEIYNCNFIITRDGLVRQQKLLNVLLITKTYYLPTKQLELNISCITGDTDNIPTEIPSYKYYYREFDATNLFDFDFYLLSADEYNNMMKTITVANTNGNKLTNSYLVFYRIYLDGTTQRVFATYTDNLGQLKTSVRCSNFLKNYRIDLIKDGKVYTTYKAFSCDSLTDTLIFDLISFLFP